MSQVERAIIKAALTWYKMVTERRSAFASRIAEDRQPLHTVERRP